LISIILPIRNEASSIERTISSILNQNNINQGFEILIADGMSNDGTRKIIQSFSEKNYSINLIDNPEQIVANGFNRALSIARGNYIIRVDGHSEINQDFITNCMKQFEYSDAECVGGPTNHVGSGIIGNAITIAQSSKFGVGGAAFRECVHQGRDVDTLAFGAYKRKVFEKIGGYDEELVRNQDDEFNFRLIQSGGRIWLDPSIKSTYYPRDSLSKLFKQYFQYGFYKIRVVQKRRSFASWRHIVPGIFVFSLLLSFNFYLLSWNPWLFYLITGSYFTANIIAALWKTIKQIIEQVSRKSFHCALLSFFLLPVVFFTLHFSYGLGSIFGLFYFWNKWGDRLLRDDHFDKEQFNLNTNV